MPHRSQASGCRKGVRLTDAALEPWLADAALELRLVHCIDAFVDSTIQTATDQPQTDIRPMTECNQSRDGGMQSSHKTQRRYL